MHNPFLPEDVQLIRQGRSVFSGHLLLADISGFTEHTDRMAKYGKTGTEDLTDQLNRYFDAMYNITRKYHGEVVSSAGDSILVRFGPDADPDAAAGEMMNAMTAFEIIDADGERKSMEIKIVIGSGNWLEFIVGDSSGAHILLSGDLIDRISDVEETACSGEISHVESDSIIEYPGHIQPHIPNDSFLGPGSDRTYGEHRSVVALFLNIKCYGQNISGYDMLQSSYLDIADIARKYKGFIQLVDCVLSGGSRFFLLFGAPRSSGDEVVNAIKAGLEIRRELEKYDSLQISCGINEGYAFAGAIGNDWSRKYTVIGDTVNTSARLADSAEAGCISVSEGIYRTARSKFDFRALGSISVKGKKEPLERFSVLRESGNFIDQYAFVGRDSELKVLIDRIEGENSIIEITGQAGVGKTSLLNELKKKLEQLDYTVFHGSAAEHGTSNSLFTSLLGTICGINEEDLQADKKKKLGSLLTGLSGDGSSLTRREVFLGRMLFALDYPYSTYDVLPPRLRRENLLDGLCEVFGAYKGPMCVILEDLHYTPEEELDAIRYIARVLLKSPGRRVSLVLSKRPDDRSFTSDPIQINRINLKGLNLSDSEQLMLAVLDGLPLEDDLERLVIQRAQGNPFYLMQFLLYLREKDLVRNSGEIWLRTEAYSDDKLPGNVFSMVMARIDRLEEKAKECLRVGSVIGIRFEERIVRKVITREVHPYLEECEEAGLAYLSNLIEMEYIFSHTLIKDVAYDSILRKRRKKIHGEIGSILEEIRSERTDDYSEVLAYHFSMAQCWSKAVEYSMKAGALAWSEYRNQNSIEHYGNALKILESKMERSHDKLALCYKHVADIRERLGEYEEALKNYHNALEHSTDEELQGSVSISIADIYYTRGDMDEAMKLLDELEETLSHSDSSHDLLVIRIEAFRAWTYCVRGEIELAMEKAVKAVRLAENLQGFDEIEKAHKLGFVYNTKATVHWANCEYNEAKEYYQKALEIAEENQMKRETAVTHGNIGLVLGKMGRYDEAAESLKRQLSYSIEIGDKLIVLSSYGELATVYASIGEFDKALGNAEEYRKQAEELPAMHDMILSSNQLGHIYLAFGDLPKAMQYGEMTCRQAKENSLEREEGLGLYLLGLISVKQGDMDTARIRFGKAESLARKVHAKNLLQQVLISLADIELGRGGTEECSRLLKEAENLTEEMGLTTGMGKIRFGKGKLFLAEGDREKAREEFDEAITIFSDFSARPDLAAVQEFYSGMLDSLTDATDEDRKRSEDLRKCALSLYNRMGIPRSSLS